MPYGLPSLDQQLRGAREASGQKFLWAHIDTCLSCSLRDHHNRDGELLLGVPVAGEYLIEDVLDALEDEFHQIAWQLGEDRKGYDHDEAQKALQRLRDENEDRLGRVFDLSLETTEQLEEAGCEEWAQAWFLLTWDVPEEEEID